MGKKNKLSKKISRSSKSSGDESNQKQQRKSKRTKKGRNPNVVDRTHDEHLRHDVEADGKRTILDMEADGNCLFRAISDQLYHDYGNTHVQIRSEVCDYLEAHKDFFGNFLVVDDSDNDEDVQDATDFESYVDSMRQDSEWGGNLELVAAARLYQRNIQLFQADGMGATRMMTFEPESSGNPGPEKSSPPLLLSYHENEHYNSVRDGSVTRPIPVVKTFDKTWSTATTVASTSSPSSNSAMDMVTENEEVSGNSVANNCNNNEKLTKNSPCPCQSGLRYKKCCWPKQKRKQYIRKLRSNDALQEENGSDEDKDDMVMSQDGDTEVDFQVLKI